MFRLEEHFSPKNFGIVRFLSTYSYLIMFGERSL